MPAPANPFGFCLPDGVSPHEFFQTYWQQKPLLIRGGMPTLAHILEPDDVLELATFDDVTARLITQDDTNLSNWQLTHAPFAEGALDNPAKLWTLLVQDLEQWSLDIAENWDAFGFLPQWLRDDIMVSYAPKGGSVGKHYDRYDVFLVQGFGQRRWQLGKFCNEKTPILPNQPLRLLDDMGDIIFDEVLNPGDVLYVPPFLAHYGVAQNDCLTYSFGLRSPNNLELMDAALGKLSTTTLSTASNLSGSNGANNSSVTDAYFWQAPCVETLNPTLTHNPSKDKTEDFFHVGIDTQSGQPLTGQINQKQISTLKQQLINAITQADDAVFADAIASSLSQRRFSPLDEDDVMDTDTLLQALAGGAVILKEPAVKLLYTLDSARTEDPLQLYCQGERIDALDTNQKWLLKKLADGDRLCLEDFEGFDIDALCDWTNNGWVTLKH